MNTLTLEQLKSLKRYEEIKISIRELEEEGDALKALVLPLIPEDEEVQGQFGKFSIMKRPNWKYSPAVKTAEESLKELKAREQADGTAEKTDMPVLYYKSNAGTE